jgi:hypothetical protein
MSNPLIIHLHQSTLSVQLAPAPKQAQTPVTSAPKASRYLGTRRVYKPDGTFTEREMWSHPLFTVTANYVKIEDGNRQYIVNAATVRIMDEAA